MHGEKKKAMSHLNLVLRAVKPEINVNRVYEIYVSKGLLNSWIVMTAYGRYGSGSHQKIYSFFSLEEAKVFVNKILRKRFNAEKRVGCNYSLIKRSSSDGFMNNCLIENM
jgi:hypothetical protein